MRVAALATLLPGLSAITVTEVTDISDPLSQWVTDPQILTHGCYCKTGGKRGIHQSDEADVFCKRWILKRRCMIKLGSICHHAYGHGIVYNLNSDGSCADDSMTCEGAMCRVDRAFALSVNAEVNSDGWAPDFPAEGTCGVIQGLGLFCDDGAPGGGVPPVPVQPGEPAEPVDPAPGPDTIYITTIPEQGVDEGTELLVSEVIDTSTHGCYCSVDRLKGSVVVDQIDEICRNWLYARFCLMKRGGACRNLGRTVNYSITSGVCDSQLNDSDPQEHCRASACAIDLHFTQQILAKEDTFIQKNDDTCQGGINGPPSGDGHGIVVKDSCCGTAPDVYSYNQLVETCPTDTGRKRRELAEIIMPENIARQIPELLSLEHDLEAELSKKITNIDLFGVTEPALVMPGEFKDNVNTFASESTPVIDNKPTEDNLGYVQQGEDLDDEEPEDFLDVNEDIRDFEEKDEELHYIPHDLSFEKINLDDCHAANLDLIFVVDGSGSVGQVNFDKNIEYLKRLSSAFLEDNQHHATIQIAVVQYSWDYQVHLEIPFSSNLETLHYKLSHISYSKGATFLGSALNFVETDVITQGRHGVPKAVVTFTDGQVSYMDKQKLDDALHSIETKATLFTVGLSKHISNQFIQTVSSVPHAKTGYRTNYDSLDLITETLGNNICKVVR